MKVIHHTQKKNRNFNILLNVQPIRMLFLKLLYQRIINILLFKKNIRVGLCLAPIKRDFTRILQYRNNKEI